MRKLKMNLDVETNALYCPNPDQWFAKSYIQENVAGNFRPIPGVKESTKIAKNTFGNLIKPAGCAWDPVDSILDAETISVCSLDVMLQVCQYDLESSFESLSMAKGETGWSESKFFSYLWADLSEATIEQIQYLRWNGDTTVTSPETYLSSCNGYLVNLEASSANNGTLDAAITKDTIIANLEALIGLLSEGVKGKKGNVRIYMSETNAFYYQLATLGLNTNFNYTGDLQLKFAGYTIAVQPGMNDDYLVAGSVESFGYAFDGEGDARSLKIVNMSDTTAEPVIRVRVGMKVGFPILNGGSDAAYLKVV